MIEKIRINSTLKLIAVAVVSVVIGALFVSPTQALNPLPTPDPKPGSFGLEATKTQPPPTTGATITTPGNGASFSNSPITVSGICPNGLMVQLLNNGVMVGTVMCQNGSFSLQVSLFAGTNELSAMVYDNVDQTGPVSNTVTVNYNNTSFTSFGELITLTSSYGRRSAPVGNSLTWPLQLSGGTGPYAFSIDWGDGTPSELKSQALPGVIDIAHVYKQAGIYQVNVMVTDVNGVSAFIQLIAVSSGKVDSSAATATDDTEGNVEYRVEILWIPIFIVILLLIPAFWLGRRSQLVSIKNKMIRERDAYMQQQHR